MPPSGMSDWDAALTMDPSEYLAGLDQAVAGSEEKGGQAGQSFGERWGERFQGSFARSLFRVTGAFVLLHTAASFAGAIIKQSSESGATSLEQLYSIQLKNNEAWGQAIERLPIVGSLGKAAWDALSGHDAIKEAGDNLKKLDAEMKSVAEAVKKAWNEAEIAMLKASKAPESEIDAAKARQKTGGEDQADIQKATTAYEDMLVAYDKALETKRKAELERQGGHVGQTQADVDAQTERDFGPAIAAAKAEMDKAKANLDSLKAALADTEAAGAQENRNKAEKEQSEAAGKWNAVVAKGEELLFKEREERLKTWEKNWKDQDKANEDRARHVQETERQISSEYAREYDERVRLAEQAGKRIEQLEQERQRQSQQFEQMTLDMSISAEDESYRKQEEHTKGKFAREHLAAEHAANLAKMQEAEAEKLGRASQQAARGGDYEKAIKLMEEAQQHLQKAGNVGGMNLSEQTIDAYYKKREAQEKAAQSQQLSHLGDLSGKIKALQDASHLKITWTVENEKALDALLDKFHDVRRPATLPTGAGGTAGTTITGPVTLVFNGKIDDRVVQDVIWPALKRLGERGRL